MKKGWEQIEMGQLCSIASGESDTVDAVENGPYAFFDRSKTIKRSSRFLYDCEALIIPGEGKEFLPRHYKGKFDLHQRAYALFDFSPQIEPRFLFHYLHHFAHYLPSVAVGATVKSLRRRHFLQLPVAVTSLAEQQRIVGVLDEAFAGLATVQAHAAQNLQNARALFESHLQSVFTHRGKGWVEKTLENVCAEIFAGGDVPKGRLSEERTAKYSVPIYSNGEKNDGLYGFTDVARVTKPSITVSARGTLGFTAIRAEPFLPVVRLIVLVPDEKQVMLSFLYYAVVGMDFGNTGTSIPQLTVPNFKESKLRVPTLAEQEAIFTQLDALAAETQRLTRLYEQKQAALAALKKSLLHQAFSGEL